MGREHLASRDMT